MNERREHTGFCLSVRQPWAWLIVNGFKDVENREWSTRMRGFVGIHAGKMFDAAGYDWVRREFPHIQMPKPGAFDLGGIVGRANIIECVTEMDSRWFVGTYGFVLRSALPLPFRPCRGKLGFFRPELAPVSVEVPHAGK